MKELLMKMRLVTCIVSLAVLAGCQQAEPETKLNRPTDSIMVPAARGRDFDGLSILISAELQKLGIAIDEAIQYDRECICLGKHVSGAKVSVIALRRPKGALACGTWGSLLIKVNGERETSDILRHEIAYAINDAIRLDRILSPIVRASRRI